jgi:hypothetical protein
VLPTIPFLGKTTSPLTGTVISQAAVPLASKGRITASLAAHAPSGGANTVTGLGADIGKPPAGSHHLRVDATTLSLENAMVAVGPFSPSSARANAQLSILVQLFSESGSFLKNTWGPPENVYNYSVSFFGWDTRTDETHIHTASIDMQLGGQGGLYRIWLMSTQFVNVSFFGDAVSNFTYDFGPLSYMFY